MGKKEEVVSQKIFDEAVAGYGEAIRKITNEKLALKARVVALEEKLKKLEKSYVDINIGDPAPSVEGERKVYVAAVAGFHKQILEKKIMHMISVSHNLLEEMGNERDYDLVIKGVLYSFREFLKWGDSMVNEHVANINEERIIIKD